MYGFQGPLLSQRLPSMPPDSVREVEDLCFVLLRCLACLRYDGIDASSLQGDGCRRTSYSPSYNKRFFLRGLCHALPLGDILRLAQKVSKPNCSYLNL